MGMFDGLIGGIVGAGMATVVNDILERNGGIPGVVQQFEQHGLGLLSVPGSDSGRTTRLRPMPCSACSGRICCTALGEVRILGSRADPEAVSGPAASGRPTDPDGRVPK